MQAWELLSQSEYDAVWDNFEEKFDFRPTVNPNKFPSIKEPLGSITYQFEYPSAENEENAITDINAKSLTAFQLLLSSNEAIYALDWQHDCYWLYPHLPFSEWRIPVFPDGDYCIFLARNFSFGIFAHPWEQTFCIWGNILLAEFQNSKPSLFEKVIRQH
jgi:hypothetical protein